MQLQQIVRHEGYNCHYRHQPSSFSHHQPSSFSRLSEHDALVVAFLIIVVLLGPSTSWSKPMPMAMAAWWLCRSLVPQQRALAAPCERAKTCESPQDLSERAKIVLQHAPAKSFHQSAFPAKFLGHSKAHADADDVGSTIVPPPSFKANPRQPTPSSGDS